MVMSLEKRSEEAVEVTAETLLNAGCDINAADNNGRTPLMYAAIFQRSRCQPITKERRKHQCEGSQWRKRPGLGEKIQQ